MELVVARRWMPENRQDTHKNGQINANTRCLDCYCSLYGHDSSNSTLRALFNRISCSKTHTNTTNIGRCLFVLFEYLTQCEHLSLLTCFFFHSFNIYTNTMHINNNIRTHIHTVGLVVAVCGFTLFCTLLLSDSVYGANGEQHSLNTKPKPSILLPLPSSSSSHTNKTEKKTK